MKATMAERKNNKYDFFLKYNYSQMNLNQLESNPCQFNLSNRLSTTKTVLEKYPIKVGSFPNYSNIRLFLEGRTKVGLKKKVPIFFYL